MSNFNNYKISENATNLINKLCEELKIIELPVPPQTTSLEDSNTLLPVKPIETFLLKVPVEPKDILPELIICAAAKDPETNRIYMSVRHGDEMFWQQIDLEYKGEDKNCCHFEQGFYTNKHRFVTREEAYIIAQQNNQINRLCPTRSKRLYSEMLY